MHFTDYTPSMWDNEEHICTLYIDISHNRQGCQWTKAIKENDTLHYLHIDFENHYPIDGKQLIFLGDQTAIGHFYALQQLANNKIKIRGHICFNDQQTEEDLTENCAWLPIESLTGYDTINQKTEQLMQQLDDKENCMFYVVGYAKMIVSLRKYLKSQGIAGEQIKSKGFGVNLSLTDNYQDNDRLQLWITAVASMGFFTLLIGCDFLFMFYTPFGQSSDNIFQRLTVLRRNIFHYKGVWSTRTVLSIKWFTSNFFNSLDSTLAEMLFMVRCKSLNLVCPPKIAIITLIVHLPPRTYKASSVADRRFVHCNWLEEILLLCVLKTLAGSPPERDYFVFSLFV